MFRVFPVLDHGMVVRLLVIGTELSFLKMSEGARLWSGAKHPLSAGSGKGASSGRRLPHAENTAATAGARRFPLRPSRAKETVLVAEDEPSLQKLIRETLEADGYGVLVAGDGEEALRASGEHAGRIDLLITEILMPGLDGRELAARLKAEHPAMKTLFISGHIGQTGLKVADPDGDTSLLSKPISPEALAGKTRALLDTPARARSDESLRQPRPRHPLP
jgi:CheY-like chemotaxis protein